MGYRVFGVFAYFFVSLQGLAVCENQLEGSVVNRAAHKLLAHIKPWKFTPEQEEHFAAAFETESAPIDQVRELAERLIEARLKNANWLTRFWTKGAARDPLGRKNWYARTLGPIFGFVFGDHYNPVFNRIYQKKGRTDFDDALIALHELEHAYHRNLNPIAFLALAIGFRFEALAAVPTPLMPTVIYRLETRAMGAQWELVSRIPRHLLEEVGQFADEGFARASLLLAAREKREFVFEVAQFHGYHFGQLLKRHYFGRWRMVAVALTAVSLIQPVFYKENSGRLLQSFGPNVKWFLQTTETLDVWPDHDRMLAVLAAQEKMYLQGFKDGEFCQEVIEMHLRTLVWARERIAAISGKKGANHPLDPELTVMRDRAPSAKEVLARLKRLEESMVQKLRSLERVEDPGSFARTLAGRRGEIYRALGVEAPEHLVAPELRSYLKR